MNEFINTMLTRRSVRSFNSEKKISQDTLDTLLKVANQSPTYAGGQQYSIIVIDDQKIKEKLVELTMPSSGRGMTYIQKAPLFLLFVMDFHKIKMGLEVENQSMEITNSLESLLIGTVDVGIATEALSAAAESLGLGTVVVGAVRRSSEALIELFQLPKYTFPILGVALGYPSEDANPNITPRFPVETLAHKNVYSDKAFKDALLDYNSLMQKHYEKRGNSGLSWTKLMSNYYKREMYPELKDVFSSQGFKLGND